jgi:voltage-gated potassium channel
MQTPAAPETHKERLYRIIFGTNTPAGQRFDIFLIAAILISVLCVVLDSVAYQHERFGNLFITIEWCFTILFTVEYLLRLYCSPNPKAYASSFYGLVDLVSILPTYIGLFMAGTSYLLVIRLLRVLRIFRVLKLLQYTGEANVLVRSMAMARRKIFIFLFAVLVIVTIFGSLMYVIEGPAYGFTSIPRSVYWAIVTVTTVGYGDITPHTIPGQFIAAMAMLTGYAIIAVPTGIISAELIHEIQQERSNKVCGNCNRGHHERDAVFCRYCGSELPSPKL